jgi:carbon-monoxide dehydrogenase medium subunit
VTSVVTSARLSVDRGQAEYIRATTLDDAFEYLADDAVPLAGGTDLVVMRRNGLQLRAVVDVKHIAELQEVADYGTWSVGSVVTIDRVAAFDPLRFGALADGARVLGAPQTRTRATLGGNVCRASPAGDTLPGLLVLGAQIELAARGGRRIVALKEFFTGPGATIREPNENATQISLPATSGGSAYERQTHRRWLDLAIAGVAIRLELDKDGACVDAAVAVAALAPIPFLVPAAAAELIGSAPDAAAVERVTRAIQDSVDPISDVRGTRDYRLRVISSLVSRSLQRSVERARVS